MSDPLVWLPFAPEHLDPAPAGLRYEVVRPQPGGVLPSSVSEVEVFVPPYQMGPVAADLLAAMTNLRVVQTLTAGVDHIRAAVVSAPCFELFEEQLPEYRAAVLGWAPRVGIEAAVAGDWARWIGADGEFVGMRGFGASAPAPVLYREFKITADAVAAAARRAIARAEPQ